MREGKIELHALSKGHYPGERMNPDTLPGVSSLGFWSCGEVQDWGLNPHRNEGLEIIFLETGEMGFEVDGKKHPLQAGNLTMTRPWQLHKLGDPNIGRGKLYWLILDVGVRRPNEDWTWPSWVVLAPHDLEDLTRKLRYGDQTVWMSEQRIGPVFRELADCVIHWNKSGATSKLTVMVNRLLVEILDLLADQQIQASSESMTRRRTVALFLKDLAENPVSIAEPWSLETMANQCGMGITSLAKYSRILVNTGPMAYLNACRLEHAATELKERPDRSITEIAFQMGFNSSQYFATQFKQRYGLTPKQYGTFKRHQQPPSSLLR